MKVKPRIVIVDDDADDREIIRDAFLTRIPELEYVFIDNGEHLLHLLETASTGELPSVILIDLNMPGKDGRDTLREIKADHRFHNIPTVVFTTSSSSRDRQTAYSLGANCFITKPDTFNKMMELAESIARLWLPENK
jgi:CheY-like chemotaxis protein